MLVLTYLRVRSGAVFKLTFDITVCGHERAMSRLSFPNTQSAAGKYRWFVPGVRDFGYAHARRR